MSKYRYFLIDRKKDNNKTETRGFIFIPKFFLKDRRPSPDISGIIEAVDEEEAEMAVQRLIRRMYPEYRLQSLREEK